MVLGNQHIEGIHRAIRLYSPRVDRLSQSFRIPRHASHGNEAMIPNPYIPTEHHAHPSPANKSEMLGLSLLAFATGSTLWLALFVGLGFNSDFGNRLTQLYGRDLQQANIDWWLFMAILIVSSLLLHGLPSICVWMWKFSSENVAVAGKSSSVAGALCGGLGLVLVVLAIALQIDAPILPVIGVSVPTIIVCESLSLHHRWQR